MDAVLGRPDVTLRTPHGTITAPTSSQLATAGPDSYLNLPGDALRPGCDYEKWYDKIREGHEPTIYSRVVTDQGQVAVQYWFYYVYNDWNDRHESDWEMIQVDFDAPTVAAALATEPAQTAYAQHEGSEVADWGSDKLRIVNGTHPVVYPGQGSHASYYSQEHWLGRGSATGFGCDDTTAPGTEVRPQVTLLPTTVPTNPKDPFAWLAFTGHWGEKQPTFNNGPTGPATKTQWRTPIAWVEDEGRPASVDLPQVPTMATIAFCGMVSQGSTLFLRLLAQPVLTGAAILAALALIGWLIARTTWRHSDPTTVDRKRTVGQILAAMFAIAWRLTPQLLPIAGVLFLSTYLVRTLTRLATHIGPKGTITDLDPGVNAWWTWVVAGLSWALVAVIDAVCAAVVLDLLEQRRDGRTADLRAAAIEAKAHRTPVYVFLVTVLLVGTAFITFWLAPVALVMLTLWSVAMAASAQEERPLRAAFRRSAALVRTRPVKSAIVALLLVLTAAGIGPFVSGVLLLLTGWPIWIEDLIGGLMTAVVMPAAVIGLGLLFFDLRRRADQPKAGTA
ncbi:hypothetical protein [Branchiibius sp. NY16-3462-2]|uniref:hypothetical protein n=1 Tax=Branchiibius sp. NY16-3462-2 TaxID=1807500 RepID=UPI0007994F0F|nr:hypothetical protein [Branchiibius sp. NY16-3462-2]KYH43700.1 hypothetical protein AZH51_02535 [Branchiibius sp. NY16-3462-2]